MPKDVWHFKSNSAYSINIFKQYTHHCSDKILIYLLVVDFVYDTFLELG